MTIPDSNGDFTVILNSDLNDTIQKNALAHELRHIDLDHFYNEDYVAQNEFEVIGAIDTADSRSGPDPRLFLEQEFDASPVPASNSSCAQPAQNLGRHIPLDPGSLAQTKEPGDSLPGHIDSAPEDCQKESVPSQTEKLLLPTSILRGGKQVVMRVARRRPLEDLLSETAPNSSNRPL